MKSFVSSKRRHDSPSGFTLIEMLVVVAIITLLMALAVPSFFGTVQANRLTAAGQNLLGRLSQAQQTASSTNTPIEVRFYKFNDSASVNTSNNFGAYQFLLVKTTMTGGAATETMEALSSPFYIESGVYISGGAINGTPASPLLTNGTGSQTFSDDGSPGSGIAQQVKKGSAKATYIAIRLYPDGSVKRLASSNLSPIGTDSLRQLQTLSLADAYVTLVGEKDLSATATPANYYAVQIDPYTGHSRAYQPGI